MEPLQLIWRDLSDPFVLVVAIVFAGSLATISAYLIKKHRAEGIIGLLAILTVLVEWYLYYALALPGYGAGTGLLQGIAPILAGWLIIVIATVIRKKRQPKTN